MLRTWLDRKPLIAGTEERPVRPRLPHRVVVLRCWRAWASFPDRQDLRPPTPKQAQHNLAALDNLIARSAINYPDHRALLQDIPAELPEETLQLYLW